MDPNDEKREAMRIKTPLVAKYRYACQDREAMIWDVTTIKDISEKGMCISTIKNFTSGEILNFHITVPFDPFRPIQVEGRVIESVGLGFPQVSAVSTAFITRVQFVDLKDEDKSMIRRYIDWFLKKGGV